MVKPLLIPADVHLMELLFRRTGGNVFAPAVQADFFLMPGFPAPLGWLPPPTTGSASGKECPFSGDFFGRFDLGRSQVQGHPDAAAVTGGGKSYL